MTKPAKQISQSSPAEYKDIPQQQEIKSWEVWPPDSPAIRASIGVLRRQEQQRGTETTEDEFIHYLHGPQLWDCAYAVPHSPAHTSFQSCHFVNENPSFHCTLLPFQHELKINCVLLIKLRHNKPISETH